MRMMKMMRMREKRRSRAQCEGEDLDLPLRETMNGWKKMMRTGEGGGEPIPSEGMALPQKAAEREVEY